MLIKYFSRVNHRFKATLSKLPSTACSGTIRPLCSVSVCIPKPSTQTPTKILQTHTKQCLIVQQRNFIFYPPEETEEPLTFPDDKTSRMAYHGGLFDGTPLTEKDRKEKRATQEIPVGKDVIYALQTMFGMTPEDALHLVSSNKLFLIPDAVVLDTLWRLLEFKIPSEHIMDAPWIILQPPDILESKMERLTGPCLFHNHIEGLLFCHLSLCRMAAAQNLFIREKEIFPQHNNRLYFLSDYFGVPIREILKKTIKMPMLLTISAQRIEHFLQLFEKYDVPKEDLFKNMRFLEYSVQLANSRLQCLAEAGIKFPKPWLLRCSDDVFNRMLSNLLMQKSIVGEGSIKEYMVKRLECTEEDLETSPTFKTYILSMNPIKVQEIIEILLEGGLTKNQIVGSLFVLRYSPKRLKSRIIRLKEMGVNNVSIGNLCKSDRIFEDYCRREQIKMDKKN